MAYHADELENRVKVLEGHHAEKMTALALLNERHDKLAEHLDKLEEVLTEVRDRVMSWRDCPNPGMCVDIDREMKALKEDVSTIKTDRAVVVKGWQLIGIVGGGVMAAGTAAYGLWLFVEKLVHRHGP